MGQVSFHADAETLEQMRILAQRWGLGDGRYNTRVLARCVERAFYDVATTIVDSTTIVESPGVHCECGGIVTCLGCGTIMNGLPYDNRSGGGVNE